MTTAWRLVKHKHLDSAFDGEGARRFGGRWNARGTPVVYVSATLSLAALELFVHLTAEDSRLQLAAVPVEIPDAVVIEDLSPDQLPRDWRHEPAPDRGKALGSRWAQGLTAAVLRVPSVIVPEESNLMLNPRHPGFSALRIGEPRAFGFDSRMWK